MIILTGSSGFLGQEISKSIESKNLVTVGRTNSNTNCDLSAEIPKLCVAELIIHSMGKAHSVPKTVKEKNMFYDTNVTGTINLLKGLEQAPSLPKSFIYISTVAVYGCETGIMVDENHPLNASDPYGKSKKEAEELIKAWCIKNNILCSILRLPLVAGTNPPGNLASMIKGIARGYYFDIGGGKARKSIVLAEDIANIIPKVAKVGGTYNLTDRRHPSFSELSFHIAKQLGKSKPWNIPNWFAVLIAKIGDVVGEKLPINSNKLRKITSDLTFDDQKAVDAFGWNPTPVLKGFKIK